MAEVFYSQFTIFQFKGVRCPTDFDQYVWNLPGMRSWFLSMKLWKFLRWPKERFGYSKLLYTPSITAKALMEASLYVFSCCKMQSFDFLSFEINLLWKCARFDIIFIFSTKEFRPVQSGSGPNKKLLEWNVSFSFTLFMYFLFYDFRSLKMGIDLWYMTSVYGYYIYYCPNFISQGKTIQKDNMFCFMLRYVRSRNPRPMNVGLCWPNLTLRKTTQFRWVVNFCSQFDWHSASKNVSLSMNESCSLCCAGLLWDQVSTNLFRHIGPARSSMP